MRQKLKQLHYPIILGLYRYIVGQEYRRCMAKIIVTKITS